MVGVVGAGIQLRLTRRNRLQGEDRDSSDEEWDAAYVALDPTAQIGWRGCRAALNSVGANLVRDVFVAADEMHESAMSAVDGNTEVAPFGEEGSDSEGEASATNCSTGRSEEVHGMEVDSPGERVGQGMVKA
jgi:hypothetical protein